MRYLLIIFTLFSFVLSESGDFGVVPMVSATWDKNIGFNYGAGLALGKWGEGIFTGIYTYYSYSKKGNNFSFGPYSGVGLAAFRFGITRLKLKNDVDKVYWGVETSPTIIMGHLRFAILEDNKKPKFSYALGLGIF